MIRFRYFIFLTFVFFAFSSFSYRKGDLYDMGFSGYSNYTGDTTGLLNQKREYCKELLKEHDGSLSVFMADCKVVLGNASEGMPEMEALGDAGLVYAVSLLGILHVTRGYTHLTEGLVGGEVDYEIWELYRYMYWTSRGFANLVLHMQDGDPLWEHLKDAEMTGYYLYLFPYHLYTVLGKLYGSILSNPATIVSNYNLEYIEDSIYFLEKICPAADASFIWTGEERSSLHSFCRHLSGKVFRPLFNLEKERVEAAKACKEEGIMGAAGAVESDKYYYDNCPAYTKVVDAINNGPAQAMSIDPDLISLSKFITSRGQ